LDHLYQGFEMYGTKSFYHILILAAGR
jgi:hypothetical protein